MFPISYLQHAIIALTCLCCSLVHAHDHFFNLGEVEDDDIFGWKDEDCLDAMNADVACSPMLEEFIDYRYRELPKADMDEICTASCLESLQKNRDAIQSQCRRSLYITPWDSTTFRPTMLIEHAILSYNIGCLTKSDGQYCNIWYKEMIDKAQDFDDCNECNIKTNYVQALSPSVNGQDQYRSTYESLTSSCGYEGPAITETAKDLYVYVPTEMPAYSPYELQEWEYSEFSLAGKVGPVDYILAYDRLYPFKGCYKPGTMCVSQERKYAYFVAEGETCESGENVEPCSANSLRLQNDVYSSKDGYNDAN